MMKLETTRPSLGCMRGPKVLKIRATRTFTPPVFLFFFRVCVCVEGLCVGLLWVRGWVEFFLGGGEGLFGGLLWGERLGLRL